MYEVRYSRCILFMTWYGIRTQSNIIMYLPTYTTDTYLLRIDYVMYVCMYLCAVGMYPNRI